MNNKEFIAELAQRNGLYVTETQRMVKTLIGAMCDSFMENNAVQLPAFGIFEVKKKMDRVMVHPATGQRILVPPKLTLSFKPSNVAKGRIRKGGDDNG